MPSNDLNIESQELQNTVSTNNVDMSIMSTGLTVVLESPKQRQTLLPQSPKSRTLGCKNPWHSEMNCNRKCNHEQASPHGQRLKKKWEKSNDNR